MTIDVDSACYSLAMIWALVLVGAFAAVVAVGVVVVAQEELREKERRRKMDA